MDSFDIAIVGGGLVGSALACALEPLGYAVLMIEAQPPRSAAPSFDERSFALARRSVQSLTALGVYARAASEAQPIRGVHVTSRGDFGAVRIRASDYGLDALGHTVPARAVGAALEARLRELRTLTRWTSARVTRIETSEDLATLRVARDVVARDFGAGETGARDTGARDGGARDVAARHTAARSVAADGDAPAGVGTAGEVVVTARLVVGADGTDSFVRDALGITVERHDYAQTAIVTTIQPTTPHENIAYERFGASGPFALLPLSDGRCGLVWTLPADEVERVLALDDGAFMAAAQEQFGARLGRFRRVGKRQPWKLQRVEAAKLVAPRAVLVGNAAQTIHPIGAQGFNLGLRDVMDLVDTLRDAQDCGNTALLARYAERRMPDRRRTADASDALLKLFAPQGELMRLARGAGLAMLDRIPPLKRELAFAMMGYREDRAA